MKQILTTCLVALTLLGASAATTREKLTVNGVQRDMKVHVPTNTPKGAPLVIACHGANQSADWHDEHSQWRAVADTAKFVLVFPDGINKFWDISGNSDINFILAIIDKMKEKHDISTNKVYLTGFSMGGMFTYHCANRIPDRIAAFVPVSGYPMGDKSAYGPRPVPLMHVHGTGDDVCVFSGVQPTLDNWIKRNGCNTTPKVIKPYPANKPGSGATMTRWLDGLDGVEVHLLQFEGKGHWQSEDPVHCLTSIEAWNFMKRWSLGPEAPQVNTVEPEDGSFDLPTDGLEVSLSFDMGVDAEGVEAVLEKDGEQVKGEAKSVGNTLTIAFPGVEAGEYDLVVRDVKGENGGLMKRFKAHYTFGYEEVGDVPPYNVVFFPDLRAEQNTVGEGIPTGWYRINTRANGQKDEKGSGSANTGGARMKYFMEGGDFNEGFYLSARDYDRCEITYGRYTPDHALHFEKGKYVATFNSAYWNEGSLNGAVTFDFNVKTLAGKSVAAFPSLPSSTNLGEQTGRITDSYFHTCEFEIPEEGDYTVTYSMTSGWAAVIVGNLKIATALSPAERYKGTFLRTLAQAKEMYASIGGDALSSPDAVALKEAIERHESLVSTAPSVYEKATGELAKAMENASGIAGVEDIYLDPGAPVIVEYYNLQGQRLAVPAGGVVIERIIYDNGLVHTAKKVVR